jgi:hypothetical protein
MKILGLIVLAGCSTSTVVPQVRFANAPPVTAVDDRRDVPQRPEKRRYTQWLLVLEGHIYKPLRRALVLDQQLRALGVNSLDEVPDSTWFTNRGELTPDDVRAAPGGVGSPEQYTPWTVHSTKVGGMSIGFIVTDTRGERFLVKFDDRGYPEAETGAQLVSGKLLWACGYNVTEDHLAYVRRGDLVLAKDAVVEDVFGHKRPLGASELDRRLTLVDAGADGRYRVMASRMLDGKPLGGHAAEGTRPDDPNDLIPHERRRDLRGLRAIFSWLDHDDIQEGQFLDMWTEDPHTPGSHYVKHYLLDYGLSLGVMARVTQNPRRSYEYYIDPGAALGGLAALGTQDRVWTKRHAPELRGVGVLEAGGFSPGDWKPLSPAYVPFVKADRFDNYWGAKLVMRFTRAQIRAAVETGRYSDPRAVEYLTNALVTRQRAIGAYWFARVNPLERFELADDGAVCFEDLALVYGFAPHDRTAYRFRAYDRAGRGLGTPVSVRAGANGRTCAQVQLATDLDGYTIVRIDTTRPRFKGTTYVHLAREATTRRPRVVGIWRV